MKILNCLREFIWPILEKSDIPDPIPIDIDKIITTENEHLKHVLDQTLKRYEAEEDRKKTVESKSAQFIGTTSILIAIVLGMTSSFLSKDTDVNLTVLLMIGLLFVLTIYISRTIWFSIRALERRNYHSLSAVDFFETSSSDYYKTLIVKIHNITTANYKAINSKVDGMVMAHEYFKRAIIVVSIYSFLMLLFFLSKSNVGLLISNLDFSANIDVWNTIALYIIGLTALLLAVRANYKKKKSKVKSDK